MPDLTPAEQVVRDAFDTLVIAQYTKDSLDARARKTVAKLRELEGEPATRDEPVGLVVQRVETALAAWISDPRKLRAVAGDVVDLAQRTLLGEVEGGHPFPGTGEVTTPPAGFTAGVDWSSATTTREDHEAAVASAWERYVGGEQ